MRKWIAVLLALSLASSVTAFEADMKVIERQASPLDPASFQVKVDNDAKERNFQVSVSGPSSSSFYVDSPKTLGPGERYTFDIKAYPSNSTIQQNYFFEAVVSTDTGEIQRFEDYFTVDREQDIEIVSISGPSKTSFRPGETATYSLEVLNTAPDTIENYSITATFMGETFEKQGLPANPGYRTPIEITVPVAEDARPGEKQVKLELRREGSTVQELERSIEVEKIDRVKTGSSETNRVITYSRTLTAENLGNYPREVTLNATIPDYLEPIVETAKQPDEKVEGDEGTVYRWSFNLEPGETAEANYTVKYWIPMIALLGVLAALVGLRKLGRQVQFTKKVADTEDGVKIHVELENRSSETMRDVEVEDFVPDIAAVREEFPMAKPVIRKTSSGTRLTWEIDRLEPGDQRVFEYVLDPMLEVEEEVTLPSATMEEGKRIVAETGKVEAEFQPRET